MRVKEKTEEPRLCLADGLAHAVFKALEPDPWWKHWELAYIEIVKVRLQSVTLMPTSERQTFVGEYAWLKDML